MPSYTENALATALNAVAEGVSVRRTARDYGIPEATLRHRKAGRQPKTNAYIYRQKLSPVQESRLTKWIRMQDTLGVAPIYT